MITKVTKEEKEQLIIKRINKIDTDKKYALEMFKTYRVEEVKPKDSWIEWQGLTDKDKRKFIEQVIEIEDKCFIKQGTAIHRWNLKKVAQFVNDCKDKQLKEFGVRE